MTSFSFQQAIAQKIQQAVSLHQSGQLAQAERLYREVLSIDPNHVDALHLLGLVACAARHYGPSEELIRRAIALLPAAPQLHYNLAQTLRAAGKLPEAVDALRQAIALKPDLVEAHANLGAVFHALGRHEDAISTLQNALVFAPASPEIRVNLALALQAAGRREEAIAAVLPIDAANLPPASAASAARVLHRLELFDQATAGYDRALAGMPQSADLHADKGALLNDLGRYDEALLCYDRALSLAPNLARAHFNRGNTLYAQQRFDGARAAFEQALVHNPRYASAFNNLGNAHKELGQHSQALAAYDKAIELEPAVARAYTNRGVVLMIDNRPAEALAAFDRAIACTPDLPDAQINRSAALNATGRSEQALAALDAAPPSNTALYNRAVALSNLGRTDEALHAYDRALSTDPNIGDAHWNRALLLLRRGELEEGFAEYEWRWRAGQFGSRNPYAGTPLWQGQAIRDKTLLVHAEQGLGDTIHFMRYLPKVLEHAGAAGRVIVECQAPLQTLLAQNLGVPVIARGAELPPFDFQIPLISLPHLFKTNLQTIPGHTPYLKADPEKVAAWADRLAALSGDSAAPRRRIGITWAGNPRHKNDAKRSMEPRELLPLLSEAAQFISLQKPPAPPWPGDLAAAPLDVSADLHDFSDAAALVANLDLVITVDTAAAHLAGALNKPVWLMIPFAGEWRWLADRDTSPWYPTARIFRQPGPGDWHAVIAQIRAALST